jgi:hypothetical protein
VCEEAKERHSRREEKETPKECKKITPKSEGRKARWKGFSTGWETLRIYPPVGTEQEIEESANAAHE